MLSGTHEEVVWWLEPLSRVDTLASCLQSHHIDLRATLLDFTARKAAMFPLSSKGLEELIGTLATQTHLGNLCREDWSPSCLPSITPCRGQIPPTADPAIPLNLNLAGALARNAAPCRAPALWWARRPAAGSQSG